MERLRALFLQVPTGYWSTGTALSNNNHLRENYNGTPVLNLFTTYSPQFTPTLLLHTSSTRVLHPLRESSEKLHGVGTRLGLQLVLFAYEVAGGLSIEDQVPSRKPCRWTSISRQLSFVDGWTFGKKMLKAFNTWRLDNDQQCQENRVGLVRAREGTYMSRMS